MTEWRRRVLEALHTVAGRVDGDELAYLALTSKIELPVRDRLAWALQERWGPRGFVVAREWSRADIAILQTGSPEVLLEAKAFYGFNVARGMPPEHEYSKKMLGDVKKACKLNPDAETFVLALSTTPLDPVPASLNKTIKYDGYINRSLANFGGGEAVLHEAREHVGARLPVLGETTHVEAVRGTAFDIEVVVDAWLVGPCRSTEDVAMPRPDEEESPWG